MEKRERKGSFDPLFISPLSLLGLARLDDGRMIFPEERERLHRGVTIQSRRETETGTRGGWRVGGVVAKSKNNAKCERL